MAGWQSAFAPWTANILFIISENADRDHYLYREGGGGESVEKVGTGVKWASHYYYITIITIYMNCLCIYIYIYIYIYKFEQRKERNKLD